MPVMASATSAPETRRAPSAIAHATAAEDALLRRVRVRDRIEHEIVARARLAREHRADEAAGARLRDRERPAARPELATDDAGERVLAFAVDDVAEARAHLGRGALRERLRGRVVLRAREDLHLDLREVRAIAD